MSNENIENSLAKTVCESSLTDMTADIGEIALDSLLKDGLLKEIPVLGTIINLTKLGITVKDYLYVKKVWRFLYNLKDITAKDRCLMVDKFESDSKYRIKFGEHLALLIDRLDDFEKADFTAKAFKAYLSGKINYTELLKLNHGISYLLITNIQELIKFYDNTDYHIDEDALQNLGNCGFIQFSLPYGGRMLGAHPSNIGEIFLIYILDKKIVLRAKAALEKRSAGK
jgi:hypothetical protein